jgi:multidrug efflux system outer membrane protein
MIGTKDFLRFSFVVLLTIVQAILVGCTLGPDYKRPRTRAESSSSYTNIPWPLSDSNTVSSPYPWWKRFGDPITEELVQKALENNTDLKAGAARVIRAKALFAESRGRRLPELTYSFSGDRSKISSTFSGQRSSFHSTTFSQDLSVNYMVDLFGRLKRSEQAAWADVLGSRAEQQALIHTIISEVVRARIRIATIQKALKLARKNTENWQFALQVVERRYSEGLIGPVDVRLARENLAATRVVEIEIEQTLKIARHGLDVLMNQQPGTSSGLPETLPDLPDLQPVPVGIPADLMDRRPDVRAAELRLAAATARVGTSIAELFPNLTLTASAGFRSDSLADIVSSENLVYSALFRLLQPIFKGGQLRARVDAAKAQAEEASAHYAGVVLKALKEVEDALVREEMLRRRLGALETRFQEARAAETLARERYFRGVEKVITVLETERRRRNAQNELIQTKGDLWNARVDLFLALGGDWKA